VSSFTAKPLSPLLAPFVKSFHYHEANFPFALERIMPNGQAHLMVNLAEDEFRSYDPVRSGQMVRNTGAVLAGPHAQSTVIDTREQCLLAAVEFRCGGAAQFFSMPMTEVCNQIESLDTLWGRDGMLLRERLLEAPEPRLKFRVFEELLLQFLKPKYDPAIQYAIAALKAGMPLSQVASRLGLLPRTLQRRFSSQVGITPKRFARVRRLQRVLRAVRRSDEPVWHELAADQGYADQAHLVHEFRELAGITPCGYKPDSNRRSNHVPIAAD
jgi:AraC-like DNA-binding protein